MYESLVGLVAEIKKCECAKANMGALVLAYVCIDACSFLSMAAGKVEQNRDDFVNWTNQYLMGHEDQPYKYAGLDVYAARCATLHTFGAEAAIHRRDPAVRKFAYHDGGKHMVDANPQNNLVLIGLPSFLNDIVMAVGAFAESCKADAGLRARVEGRLPQLMALCPLVAIQSIKS